MSIDVTIKRDSACINPHTGQLTSNRNNTKVEDWEKVKSGFKQLDPIDILKKRDFKLPDSTIINHAENLASLAEGAKIQLNGGYYITLTEDYGFVLSPTGEEKYFAESSGIRDGLNRLLAHSSADLYNLHHAIGKSYDAWEDSVTKGLELIGIDIDKDFTFNGVNYTRDEEGKIVSEKMIAAKVAFERQQRDNLTYEFSDKRTKQTIQYRSEYYLRTASEDIKKAWDETLKETNVNPFATTYGNAISQIAMEQDFATGGNDQLFGGTMEESIESVEKILDRIDNPLGIAPEESQEYKQQEREFYATFLSKLKNMQ